MTINERKIVAGICAAITTQAVAGGNHRLLLQVRDGLVKMLEGNEADVICIPRQKAEVLAGILSDVANGEDSSELATEIDVALDELRELLK